MEIRSKLLDLLKEYNNDELRELYEIEQKTINIVLKKSFIRDPVQFTRIYYAWYNEFKKNTGEFYV